MYCYAYRKVLGGFMASSTLPPMNVMWPPNAYNHDHVTPLQIQMSCDLYTTYLTPQADGWTDIQSRLTAHGFRGSEFFTILFILLGHFLFTNLFIGVIILVIFFFMCWPLTAMRQPLVATLPGPNLTIHFDLPAAHKWLPGFWEDQTRPSKVQLPMTHFCNVHECIEASPSDKNL